MMTDTNGALFPLSKNFLGTVKDPAWTVRIHNSLFFLLKCSHRLSFRELKIVCATNCKRRKRYSLSLY